jgi:hypothetical protein
VENSTVLWKTVPFSAPCGSFMEAGSVTLYLIDEFLTSGRITLPKGK